MTDEKIKVNNRVKRANAAGCLGVVQELRKEVMSAAKKNKETPLLVKVQWDNGTTSYFSPESLEVVK